MPIVWSVAACIAAYLLGSVSFAVIVSRAFGLADPRTYGSKNPGATNVLRSGSKVAAVLTLLLVGTGMLLLDWQLGLVVLAGFIPLTWLTVWFRRESARAYRRTRETIALVIVHFVETFGGIRAVQAFRREKRNSEIFSGLGRDYADANTHAGRISAISCATKLPMENPRMSTWSSSIAARNAMASSAI